jgi:hypothetical protein
MYLDPIHMLVTESSSLAQTSYPETTGSPGTNKKLDFHKLLTLLINPWAMKLNSQCNPQNSRFKLQKNEQNKKPNGLYKNCHNWLMRILCC